MDRRLVRLLFPAAIALAVAGCASIGPASIVRDRVDYSDSIADSWKRQALTNVVRLRYMDTPIFLDVSSVVASYGLGANVGANANINTSRSTEPGASVSGAGELGQQPDHHVRAADGQQVPARAPSTRWRPRPFCT